MRLAFAPAFSLTIAGAESTKSGDAVKFIAKQGSTSFRIGIDSLRETVTVSAKNVELDDFGASGTKRGY